MVAVLQRFLLVWLSLSPFWLVRAQPPALPVRAVRSISPADADFSDLEFLRQEIGPARVVLLGEPTHGEGNVFEAKVRLIRFLHERMGFTTVAFESGIYDLRKAQQALEAGQPAHEALENSVFAVWTGTREFQALYPFVGPGKLRVAGFDPQLSSEYSEQLVEDLEAFLQPERGGATLDYDYLDEVISFMGEHFMFLPTTNLADFEKEIKKTERVLQVSAGSKDARRRADAAFWQQCLRSLVAQARDYATADPGVKTEQQFKAIDSNPRDAQMADNLIWYVQAHPQEKVLCWGALPHLSNRAATLDNAELRVYRPMGQFVKTALGADQVYILGTLAGSGTHGFTGMGGYQPVPPPAAGTLEAELLAQPADYAFVSLKHDAPGRQLTTYAFEYTPFTGPWSEVVDGFLFLRTVNPPHGAVASAAVPGTAPDTTMTTARSTASPRNPTGRARQVVQPGAGATGQTLRGVVLDRKTGQPVPYASVAMPAQGVGTVADGQGRFMLTGAGAGALQISSVGYGTATVPPPTGGAALTVRLTPAAYALETVQVRGESVNPRKIMKKVLAALPTNYEQQDYSAQVYARRSLSNFDTLSYESESVSQLFEPAGFRNWAGGFLMLGPGMQLHVQQVRVLTAPKRPLGGYDLIPGGQGFLTASADPVRISPLFKASTWRKFSLRLDSIEQSGTETVYVLSFAARRTNHRTTGTYLMAGYSGRIYIQQRDYAVLRYEALWHSDTLKKNALARKYAGRNTAASFFYRTIYTDSRTDHVVTYRQGANGRYYVASSIAQGLNAGRSWGKPAYHHQVRCEEYFTPLPANTPALEPMLQRKSLEFEIAQLYGAAYRPAFWETYRRPLPAVEGSLPAKAPR